MSALIDPTTGQPFARGVEISRDVEKRLQKVERRWFLRHVAARPPYWALMQRWMSTDPRHAGIQRGDFAANTDFDMIGQYDGNLSAESVVLMIEAKAERNPVKTEGEAQTEAQRRMDEVAANNAKAKQAATETFIHEQNEKGGKRTKHERELSVGDGTANPMSTSATPKHKRTDLGKGVDADDRNEQAIAMAGGDPFPTNPLDFTKLHDDSIARFDTMPPMPNDGMPNLVPAEK